jgi:Protein of unknown function (DUF2516)
MMSTVDYPQWTFRAAPLDGRAASPPWGGTAFPSGPDGRFGHGFSSAYQVASRSGYAGDVFGLNNALLSLLSLAIVVVQGWALVDCVLRPAKAFEAAGKLTKPAWLAITAIALVVGLLFGPLGILGLAGIVASIVYLVDVRPAVRQIQGGGDRW